MARPGPEPKNVKHGHGGAGWIDVPNTPYTGPGSDRDLPPMDGGIRWYPQVEAWWEIVRVMPHCRLWEASDWMFAGGAPAGATPITAAKSRRERLAG
jgi:hypothetical protein